MKNEVYFFAGIGGIGMSALARHLHRKGIVVFGFDRQPSKVSLQLEAEGIPITYSDRPEDLPESVQTASTLEVIYTPALAADHPLLSYFRAKNFLLRKRSVLLQEISAQYQTLAVAGTHGKTTTSALLTHLLRACGQSPTAFLGGLISGDETNYYQGKSERCVVEADEFDWSFLRLNPAAGIITSVEPDHLDIYGTEEAYQQAFEDFQQLIVGPCVVHQQTGLPGITYGGKDAVHRIENLTIDQGSSHFQWHGPHFVQEVEMRYPGLHNLDNALAAMALCAELGLPPTQIAQALPSFPGVWRRMEKLYSSENRWYYDDYAHHPGELKALIQSLKKWHPQLPLTLVFQPHLFSRTRDFLEGFAEALSAVDQLILLPIYPAREQPIPGVSSDILLQECHAPRQVLLEKEQLLPTLDAWRPELLVTAGAGDIDRWVQPIAQRVASW